MSNVIYTAQHLNIKFSDSNTPQETKTGAIMLCSSHWTIEQLHQWMPKYTLEMLNIVKGFLMKECVFGGEIHLEVWCR